MQPGILTWLHIGDLHITEAGLENHRDLMRIVALANALPPGSLDFVVLPGDNADDGTPEQFDLVRQALAGLRPTPHILPGDHDFKPRGLDAFYRGLNARRLPYAETVKGHRCLFLDVVSAGTGGPDFRLDKSQLDWLDHELTAAGPAAVFMHTYPADLREGAERLLALLARPRVRIVDMGHTHYNELANDGSTIFMATRSTGQIEEGPSGFSIAAIDATCVSWRFKPLDHAWPCVLVTSPADHRLVTAPNQTAQGAFTIRARVLGDAPIESVEVSVNDRDWAPMTTVPGETALWQAQAGAPVGLIRVRTRDALGRRDEDSIDPTPHPPPVRASDGSDRDRIAIWPEKHLLGTQLGPNRNGRKW